MRQAQAVFAGDRQNWGGIVGYIHMRRDFFSPLRLFSAKHLPAFGGKRG